MTLQENLTFLSAIAPSLATEVSHASHQLEWNGQVVLRGTRTILDPADSSEFRFFASQLSDPRKIILQRPVNILRHNETSVGYEGILDSHQPVVLSELGQVLYDGFNPVKPSIRDYILVSSHVLVCISRLTSDILYQIRSLVVVENDPINLAAALMVVSLPELVERLKAHEVGLEMLYDQDSVMLHEKLFVQLTHNQPISLGGLGVIQPQRISPQLIGFVDTCFSQSKMAERFIAQLGSSTDNLNHFRQAAINLSSCAGHAKMLLNDSSLLVQRALITGSGPSLDDQLIGLQLHADSYYVIAAGSSIKSLLMASIIPNALVLLERASELYDELSTLSVDYPCLRDVVLIASVSIDSRIANLFERVYFFVRPAMAYACLDNMLDSALSISGPEAVNAAIDAALFMGFTKISLLGCDLGSSASDKPRSLNAFSDTHRDLDKPVLGNNGKTIFTQPSLEYARDSLSYLLNYYAAEDVSVDRYGVGLPLDSEKVNELPSVKLSDYILQDKSATLDNVIPFTPKGRDIDSRILSDDLYRSLLGSLSGYLDEIRLSFECLNPTSISFHRILCQLLGPPEGAFASTDDPSLLIIKALLREPLFYVYLSYQDHFDHLDEACSQGDQLLTIYNSFVSPAIDFLQDALESYLKNLWLELSRHTVSN